MDWWETAQPGDKVTCVTKGIGKPPSWPSWLYELLEIGETYTIRSIHESNAGIPNIAFLVLDEIASFNEHLRPHKQLDARAFAPVQNGNKSAEVSK